MQSLLDGKLPIMRDERDFFSPLSRSFTTRIFPVVQATGTAFAQKFIFFAREQMDFRGNKSPNRFLAPAMKQILTQCNDRNWQIKTKGRYFNEDRIDKPVYPHGTRCISLRNISGGMRRSRQRKKDSLMMKKGNLFSTGAWMDIQRN